MSLFTRKNSLKKGELKEAFETIKEVHEAASKMEFHELTLDTIISLLEVCWLMGEFEKGSSLASEALMLLEKKKSFLTEKDIKYKKALVLKYQGNLYYEHGDLDTSMVCIRKGLKIAEKMNFIELKAMFRNNLGNVFLHKGELDTALECYQKALSDAIKVNNNNVISVVLHNIGVVYRNKGEFYLALQNFERSLNIEVEEKRKPYIAYSLYSIGVLYFAQKKFKEALSYFLRSYEIRLEIGHEFMIAYSLLYIIIDYLYLGEKEKALEYLESLRKINEQSNNPELKGFYKLAQAFVYRFNEGKENRTKAIKLLSEIIKKKNVELELVTLASVVMAEVLLETFEETGDSKIFEKLNDVINGLLAIAREQRNYRLIIQWLLLKAKIALLELNTAKALALISQGLVMADERGFTSLAKHLEKEHDNLVNILFKWIENNKNQASPQSISKELNVLEYLRNVIFDL